jgi:biofilm protein TabA
MILDRMENAARYTAVHPGFAKAFEYLKQTNFDQVPVGRHELVGNQLFALVANDQGRARSGAKLEAHRKYIDIQYVVRGCDEIGWKPTKECTLPDGDFNFDRDICFFADAPESWVALPSGTFVILYPEDAHAPLAGVGDMRKIVMKVAVDWSPS